MTDLLAALGALRDEYAAALPSVVDELRSALEHARASPADREALDLARLFAHRLHGAAGSFGFSEASRAAGRIEQALDQPGDVDWAEIDRALDELSPDGPASRPDPHWPG